MKKEVIHIVLFAGFLLLGGSLCVLHPGREFSEMENRTLTGFPEVTAGGIASGEVQRDFERAASDQIAGRDQLVQIATGVRYALGERDIGDVYIGSDGRYLEKVTDDDISAKRLDTNVAVINKLCGQYPDTGVTLFMAPTDSVVCRELLPKGARLYDDGAVYERIEGASDFTVLYEPGEYSLQDYFSTDHHWNTYGALRGSRMYLSSLGREEQLSGEFSYERAGEPFFGTLYSKAPLYFCPGEDFDYPVMDFHGSVSVAGEDKSGFYDEAYFDKKDKYAAYFGGNFSTVIIDNPDAATDKTLLVVKDSFFNSAAPYLSAVYLRIVMVDLRYFNDSFGELMERERPDELLFFYEMSDFFEDENFSKLLRGK